MDSPTVFVSAGDFADENETFFLILKLLFFLDDWDCGFSIDVLSGYNWTISSLRAAEHALVSPRGL